jgi:hypothetical protein
MDRHREKDMIKIILGIAMVGLLLAAVGGQTPEQLTPEQKYAQHRGASEQEKIPEKKKACVGPDAEWVEDSAQWGHGFGGDCFRGAELRRKQKLTQEIEETNRVCSQFDGREKNACYAYGPKAGLEEISRRREKKDPDRCRYLSRVYQSCADRNGASQCRVEEKAIFESEAC